MIWINIFVLVVLSVACKSRQFGKASFHSERTVTLTKLTRDEAELWRTLPSQSDTLNLDFPVLHENEAPIYLSDKLRGEWKWDDIKLNQIAEWGNYFSSTESCDVRKTQSGTPYPSLGACIDAADEGEKGLLAGIPIFRSVTARLRKTKEPRDERRALRMGVDKYGVIQCIFFADKRPDLAALRTSYPDAIPDGAVQVPALEIHHLLAAPWNLLPNHERKVTGAGRACLKFAALESLRTPWQGRVILESVPTAIGFYQRLGFQALGVSIDPIYGETPLMWLSASAALDWVGNANPGVEEKGK